MESKRGLFRGSFTLPKTIITSHRNRSSEKESSLNSNPTFFERRAVHFWECFLFHAGTSSTNLHPTRVFNMEAGDEALQDLGKTWQAKMDELMVPAGIK